MSDPQSIPEPESTRPQSDNPFAARENPFAAREARPSAEPAPASPAPAPQTPPAPGSAATTAQFPSHPAYAPQAGSYPTYGQQPTSAPTGAGSGGAWVPPGSNLPPNSPFAQPPRRKSPVLKILAGVAAAGIIALSSAIAGGVVGAALVDKHPVTTQTINAAPAIDRASLADIAAAVSPSVVSITTETGEGSG